MRSPKPRRGASLQITALGNEYTPIGKVVDERAVVNGIVGLLATGGSTNHTIHLVAMARAAGVLIDWDDFNDLSAVVPLLAKIYPNGKADVNHFHAAGGMGYLIAQLLDAGLVHADVSTVAGAGLARYAEEPFLADGGGVTWRKAPSASGDREVLRGVAEPFSADGGLKLLSGNLGRAVIKVSAVKPEHRVVEAPAIVFNDQAELMAAFDRGELKRDFVAVVRYQGPRANGMPELHKLTPPLGVLQDEGWKVALVTDGRMSGASGKVPAAIHVTPECLAGGPLARVRTGDVIVLDSERGVLEARVDAAAVAIARARNRRPRRVPPRHGARAVRRISRQRARRGAGRDDLPRGRAKGKGGCRPRRAGPRSLCLSRKETSRERPGDHAHRPGHSGHRRREDRACGAAGKSARRGRRAGARAHAAHTRRAAGHRGHRARSRRRDRRCRHDHPRPRTSNSRSRPARCSASARG